jgi:hypothetical protein
MKSIILGILFLSIASICLAQEADKVAPDAQLPRWMLRTNMLSPLNPFKQSASFTAEFPVLPQLTAEAVVGYTFHAGSMFIDQAQESYRGPQFRIGMKYYSFLKKNDFFYLGIEAKHERITHLLWSTILRHGSQYSEVVLAPRNLTTWGGVGKVGFLFFLDPSKRLILDVYFGLGANRHFVKFDLPPDTEVITSVQGVLFSVLHPEGLSNLPTVVFGIHLGYAFW